MPRARESRPSGRVSQMLVVICCRNIQLVRRQRPAMLIPKDCSLDCQSFSFYGIFRSRMLASSRKALHVGNNVNTIFRRRRKEKSMKAPDDRRVLNQSFSYSFERSFIILIGIIIIKTVGSLSDMSNMYAIESRWWMFPLRGWDLLIRAVNETKLRRAAPQSWHSIQTDSPDQMLFEMRQKHIYRKLSNIHYSFKASGIAIQREALPM